MSGQRIGPPRIAHLIELEEVGNADPSGTTRPCERDFAILQKLHEVRPGNIEQVGCLLLRQFGLRRGLSDPARASNRTQYTEK